MNMYKKTDIVTDIGRVESLDTDMDMGTDTGMNTGTGMNTDMDTKWTRTKTRTWNLT
jgi:hypothetical protein